MGRRTGRRLLVITMVAILLLLAGLGRSDEPIVIAAMVLAGGVFLRLLHT